MILDGWGIAENKEVSAIDKASTPFMDSLYGKYPNSTLKASGDAVGLPEGQMGNSEVGHMNLGAGRIVYQMLEVVNRSVQDGSIAEKPELQDAFTYCRDQGKKLHLIGLVSDGGVHSHILHLKGLVSAAAASGLEDVFVHAFTDGRDCAPDSGKGFIADLVAHMKENTGKLASVTGRYYAMDRDKRWQRVKLAYDAMVNGEGKKVKDFVKGMQESYDEGVTDEFVKPMVGLDHRGEPVATIEEGDAVICFNFRTDRGRQITEALSQKNFPDQDMKKLGLYYVTMTEYDDTFKDVRVIFKNEKLKQTLGEILQQHGKKQIRIAETEKYPHVTYFFSGGAEEPFKGESRIMCDSPQVATYDLQPEMSAACLRDKIVEELKKKEADFVCLNFANPDMVGHTGVFDAVVKACETVDSCASDVVDAALQNGYATIIIADHGNADYMKNPDGSVHTAHTTSLVPCILVDKEYNKPVKSGKLGDIAPTILELLGIEKPAEMTGESLL
mgnify:CR=1 FL=1